MNCVQLVGNLTGPVTELDGTGPDGSTWPSAIFGVAVPGDDEAAIVVTVVADGPARDIEAIAGDGDLVFVTGRLEGFVTPDGPTVAVRVETFGTGR